MNSRFAVVAAISLALVTGAGSPALGQEGPEVVDPNLQVTSVASGLVTPIGVAFLGQNDFLVLEKNTGKVKRFQSGVITGTVLDLGVNFASERGLLGIALQPGFASNHGVYLFWSCPSTALPTDPFFPDEERCLDSNMFAADTDQILRAPLLGNRVDRFVWNGSTLTYDHNLIMLRSFQNDGAPTPAGQGDETQPPRGNHDGGVIAFGPDGKLYVMFGDAGRRGALQNLECGPTATECDDPAEDATPDDQFGGPAADDAHFSGVILRLNPDGTAPSDNPLFAYGAEIGGEVGDNLKKTFAYGVRNSFGMAFDPISGRLWDQENGEDAYDEINLVERGMNSGWIQFTGPSSRVADYKLIESTSLHHEDFPNLQQFRWGPERIAASASEAKARLHVVPGSSYSEPEFSWKFVLAPAAIGFVDGSGLGAQYAGDMLVGFSVPDPDGGPLFRFNLTGNRRKLATDDPRLADRVADNVSPHEMTESESLVFGTGFGVVTDIETAPDGSVYIVSIDRGEVLRISKR